MISVKCCFLPDFMNSSEFFFYVEQISANICRVISISIILKLYSLDLSKICVIHEQNVRMESRQKKCEQNKIKMKTNMLIKMELAKKANERMSLFFLE